VPDVSGKPRVLIVDDECVIADTLALILSKNGYAVSVAYSGEDAVRLAEIKPPDILITDVVMGGMSGIEAAIEVCQRVPKCRTILISGQAGTNELLRQVRARGYDFEVLLKPVHPQALLERLKSAP
jgi:DNA-binding response OmpR family regulator